MIFRFCAAAALLLLCVPVHAHAAFHLHRQHRTSSVTLRKRLHINDLIAAPGTAELDWGNLYSFTTSNFAMPSTMKFTPAGNSVLWGRTEYSVGFDSVSSTFDTGIRTTQFSDRVTVAATSVVLDTTHFDIAIAPQATFLLRDTSGERFGATAIAREDIGLNSMGATVSWTGATKSSTNNPAGTWDFGAGFGRHLAAKGVLGQFTPHVNAVWERSTDSERSFSAFAGIEYQITPRVAFDVTGQRVSFSGGGHERQILVGMTVNLRQAH